MTIQTKEKLKVGRPAKHLTLEEKKAANATAAKEYRARQKAKKQEWRDPTKRPRSSIIDLSALAPPWHLPSL